KSSEGLASGESIRKRFRLTDAEWERLGGDDALVEKIEILQAARGRSGKKQREKAQKKVDAAVETVNGIVADPRTNKRHRVGGARLLDSFAGFASSEPPADEERVIVTINLGADVVHFDRPLRPTPTDDKIVDAVPGFLIPAKDTNDGGQPL